MKKILNIIILVLISFSTIFSQIKLEYSTNKSVSYQKAIDFYRQMADDFSIAEIISFGVSDSQDSLHLFIISKDNYFTPEKVHKSNKPVILINNGIHPGEPCGIDASLKFADELLNQQKKYSKLLDKVVICIVPVYNIGGALNRGKYSRANQNGPDEYGFRGNARLYDLNRDFMKCDTKNTHSFIQMFNQWQPDVLVDTHTSNGADYQYVMTLIPTLHNKLHPSQANFLTNTLLPQLYEKMGKSNFEMTPYVYPIDKIPDNGIQAFYDSPRYTSGYAALFNTLAFITEAHMFKPFKDRVLATYYFLKHISFLTAEYADTIGKLKKQANKAVQKQKDFVIDFQLDTSIYEKLLFKGYKAVYTTSGIHGRKRLYYDRNFPYEKEINFYHSYRPSKKVTAPEKYVIPQAWQRVIRHLKWNGVKMYPLHADTMLTGRFYYITSYKTSPRLYGGHYFHYQTKTSDTLLTVNFRKGDMIVPVNQIKNNYIVQALEPECKDSFFNWNFFDSILQRKEFFSAYVFEDKALELLDNNKNLKREFENKKKTDTTFNQRPYQQLLFLYKHSKHYEPTHLRYPVARIY